MTSESRPPFDELAAPPESGGVLIVPQLDRWPGLIEENRRRLASLQRFDEPPSLATPAGEPAILLGHQPDFFHPGVWIKSVAASHAASAIGGRAEFLVADHDDADGLRLRWPARDGDIWIARAQNMGPAGPGCTFEHEPPRSAAHWREAWQGVSAEYDRSDTGLADFISGFFDADRTSGHPDYVDRWMAGVIALDRRIGLVTPVMRRASRLSSSPRPARMTWGGFVTYVVKRHAEFAAAYNAALQAYRAARGISGDSRPIPDLLVSPDRVELPFWIHRRDHPRGRLYLTCEGGQSVLWAADLRAAALPSDGPISPHGELGGWCIRPRALTLTMYARLFLCDLFVHGLGGAKYDVVTDDLIRRFIGIEPPAYVCVTATLRLPLDSRNVSQAELAQAMRGVRDTVHNPQRWLLDSAPAAELLSERAAAIAESERLRRECRDQHLARRRIFDRIHQLNARLHDLDPDMDARAQTRITDVRRHLASRAVASSREWFYALHHLPDLRRLADQIRDLRRGASS